jgi:hypothetical protein
MTIARSRRRYPQPPLAAEVLAGARCEHGAQEGRCPLCRAAGLDPGTPAAPEPVASRPRRPRRRPKPEPQPVQLPLPSVDDDPRSAARRSR